MLNMAVRMVFLSQRVEYRLFIIISHAGGSGLISVSVNFSDLLQLDINYYYLHRRSHAGHKVVEYTNYNFSCAVLNSKLAKCVCRNNYGL